MAQNDILFTVTAASSMRSKYTVEVLCWRILLAMMPAAVAAVYFWGFSAISVMCLAMLAGVITEAICWKMMGRTVMSRDFTGVVSCLALAFLMPASSPWWLVVLGATITISLGKMVFGGTGANPLNATIIGWATLTVSWPELMSANSMELNTTLIDPLIRFKFFGVSSLENLDYFQIFCGKQIGALGASQCLMLLLGGLYIVAIKAVRWEIPASFFTGVILASFIPWVVAPATNASPIFHLITGSTILCGFFLATDWASSPSHKVPMLIYGFFAGVMVIVIRKFGVYLDGAPFAVLLANLIAPLLDCITPKPFGWKGVKK